MSALLLAGCGDSSDGTFERIQSQVFDRSCSSSSCHDADEPAAGLALAAELSHADLVGAPPWNQAAANLGFWRVHPRDPERSFLLMKLTGELTGGLGEPMPKGAGLLDPSTIEIIQAWIEAGAPRTGRVDGDDGRELNAGGGPGDIRLDPPERGVQIEVVARAIAAGEEETLCHFLKLPSADDLDVNRVEIAVGGGSHHIHVYRPYQRDLDLPDGFEDCNSAVDFDVWELVALTQLPRLDWKLPEGIAIHLEAGEQLLVQTHFVNVGQLATSGEGRVLMNLHAAEPGTTMAHAGSLFGQNRDVRVPARSNVTMSGRCVFPKPLTLIAQSGHYHFRGRRFSTFRWQEGARGAELYHHEGYEDPVFLIHDDGPRFAAGEGIEWECYWQNSSDRTYTFGPFTDRDEHCNLFAFYYPAAGTDEAITCVTEEGKHETVVRRTRP